jgi:flagellar protein FliS
MRRFRAMPFTRGIATTERGLMSMKPAGSTYKPNKPMIGRTPVPVSGGGAATGSGSGDGTASFGAGAGGAAFAGASAGGTAFDGSSTAGAANSGSAAGIGAAGAVAGKAGGAAGHDAEYRTARVMSASPLELILIMYEQLFALISDIKRDIAKKAPTLAEPNAERAHAIVEELINALDFSVDLSKDLGAIYYFVRDRIMEANIKFDAAIWDQVYDTMRPLYEGFLDASRQLGERGAGRKHANAGQPSIVAGMTYGQGNLNEIVINTKNGLKA